MNILLIYPPQIQNPQKGLKGFSPPLGLLYLASYLDTHDVDVVDMDTEGRSISEILSMIEKKGYDVVGITSFTRTRYISYEIANEIKKNFPSIYVLLGGASCILNPEDAVENSKADCVVSGEAEHIINEIIDKKPTGIITVNPPSDLDKLKFPNRKLLDHSKYGFMMGIKLTKNTASIMTSRGCPYNCSFCTRIAVMKNFRVRSPKKVVEEIKQIENEGFNGVLIVDDNFTAIPKRAIKIAQLIKKEKIKMDFGFQGRCIPSRKLWRELSSAGFNMTFVGIEHIKPELVKYFNKYPNPSKWKEVVRKSVEIMNENNVLIGGSIILGAPAEKREDAEECIDYLYKIGVDVVNTNELEYVYGAKLWFDGMRNGIIPKGRLHIRVSEIFEKEYLEDLYTHAWNKAIGNKESMMIKAITSKNDKWTCLNTGLNWLKYTNDIKAAHDGYGYGKRSEVNLT